MGAAIKALITTHTSNKPSCGCNTTSRKKSVGVCTLAGSILTMDAAFRMLVGQGLPLTDVARLCASTAAESLGLRDAGQIAEGRRADLVVLDQDYRVRQTYVAGVEALEPRP